MKIDFLVSSRNFIMELSPLDVIVAAAKGTLVDVVTQYFKKNSTPLHMAVENDDIAAIQTFVRAGADINMPDKWQHIPLQYAVERGRPSCVDALIKLGADINYGTKSSTGRTVLMLAASEGQHECMQLLIEAGADIHHVCIEGLNALMLAAMSNEEKCLRLLIRAGADLNLQCKDFEDTPKSGNTAVMFATEVRSVNCLKLLLEAGADVNVKASNGESAIHCTSHWLFLHDLSETIEIAKILIEFGSDVNAVDNKGETVLMKAVTKTYRGIDLVHLLSTFLQAGAVVDQQDSEGMTALAHAVSHGNYEYIRCLIDHGASVNTCNHSGRTPLHHLMAKWSNVRQCLEALLSKQPDVNATDKDGMTPLMCMAKRSDWRPENAAMLLEHGAEINQVDNLGRTALIYSLDSFSHDEKATNCYKVLLNMGANLSVGLALLDCDLDLIKLQVGYSVDLGASWEQFVKVFDNNKRNILQFLIINGVMPSQPSLRQKPKSHSGLSTNSLLGCAVERRNRGAAKYLIASCYLRAEDLRFSCSGHEDDQYLLNLMSNLRSQPWPLVKLCFVAVSTVFGASPGRQERVKNSQLPVKIQKMLLFQEPWSRLCVHQWDKIPLTFSPDEYEKLPRPRPLLYYWPVGRHLVLCDCGKCDGTMYRHMKLRKRKIKKKKKEK